MPYCAVPPEDTGVLKVPLKDQGLLLPVWGRPHPFVLPGQAAYSRHPLPCHVICSLILMHSTPERSPCVPAALSHKGQLPLFIFPACPYLACISFPAGLPLYEAPQHIYVIPARSQPCNCTQTVNFSYLFPMLYVLVCRYFKEATQHAYLPERVCVFSIWSLIVTFLLTHTCFESML